MKKQWKQVLSVVLVLCMALAAAGCGKNTDQPTSTNTPAATSSATNNTTGSADTETSTSSGTSEAEPVVADTYTQNSFMGASPLNWNPHAWETNADNVFAELIDVPLVTTTIADDGVNFEWVFYGSESIVDVTSTFADKEKWEIPADATEHYVYEINLQPTMTWTDGTPINADSYVYSMKQLLDPNMKNYRANNYFSGDSAIKGAANYYNNDKAGSPKYGSAMEAEGEQTYYINVADACYFFGDAMKTYYDAGYDAYFADADGNDLYAKYADAGYVEVTDEVKADLLVIANNFGDDNPEAWIEFCLVQVGIYEEFPWENVGLVKTGEYQFVYILEYPLTPFYFYTSMTSTWLVKEDLYEAGKESREGLVATNYNTTLETTDSYGPYKLVSFEKDKQFVLERNDKWFGWNHDRFKNWFATTGMKIDIIAEHNTAMQLFLQGSLDSVDLTSEDMPTYRMSDYLLKTDETYTMRFIFATSLESLKALEAEANDGANKQVLSYRDFRKALSLSIDRARFCAEATSAFKPAYYLMNSIYYYDIENDPTSIYRNTTQAKEAVLRLYNISYGEGTPYATVDAAYNAVTGYDEDVARELFQSVYEQAIADGRYTDGQLIKINCMCSAASSMNADDTRQQDLLNEFIAAATKGTGFEGKITITFQSGASTRYDDVAQGRIEMIRGAWGGAAFYPFSVIRLYTEPDYMKGLEKIHESNGWNPTVEKLEITYDFDGDGTAESRTETFQNWAKSINPGGEFVEDPTTSLAILSYLETGVLETYQCIPVASQTAVSMFSQKLKYATLDYNIMYGYGGDQLLTYNYTDKGWTDYVASQGGVLNYE